jgi:transposase
MIMRGCTIEREKNRRCPEHGIKSMAVPWALRESRSATMCEVFAIEVLLMTQTVKGVLAISRRHVEDTTWRIIERTVAREKVRTEPSLLPRIGIDEKAFAKGITCISISYDLGNRTVEAFQEGYDTDVAKSFFSQLSLEHLRSVGDRRGHEHSLVWVPKELVSFCRK